MSFSKIPSPPGRVRTRRLITALRCLGTLVALHAGSGRATVAPPPDSAGIRVAEALTIAQASSVPAGATAAAPAAVDTVSGMPPVIDPGNLYSETGVGRLNPATAGALSRVYVPNRQS